MISDAYQIVVVGVSKKQKKYLPDNILGIERTYDSAELAEIYSSAYAFINPTYEDNFPNVNIEALSCGTPVITYNTGGAPEIINSNNGVVLEKGNVRGILKAIMGELPNRTNCVRSVAALSREATYARYIELYKELL